MNKDTILNHKNSERKLKYIEKKMEYLRIIYFLFSTKACASFIVILTHSPVFGSCT